MHIDDTKPPCGHECCCDRSQLPDKGDWCGCHTRLTKQRNKMKLPKLIELLTSAASICDDTGEECEVVFKIGDDELELAAMVGEGTAVFPTERGDLSVFSGWQKKLSISFRLLGDEDA